MENNFTIQNITKFILVGLFIIGIYTIKCIMRPICENMYNSVSTNTVPIVVSSVRNSSSCPQFNSNLNSHEESVDFQLVTVLDKNSKSVKTENYNSNILCNANNGISDPKYRYNLQFSKSENIRRIPKNTANTLYMVNNKHQNFESTNKYNRYELKHNTASDYLVNESSYLESEYFKRFLEDSRIKVEETEKIKRENGGELPYYR